jgi:hypothetical protein
MNILKPGKLLEELLKPIDKLSVHGIQGRWAVYDAN